MDFCSKTWLASRVQGGGFTSHCGVTITDVDETGAEGEMALGPQHMNPNQGVHGGAFYTLADSVAGTAALAWGLSATGKTVEELSCTTVNSSFSFLRPGKGSKLTCRADHRKMGRTLAVVDVSLRDDRGQEVSSGTFTFLYVDRARFIK